MQALGVLLYLGLVIGVTLFVLSMLWRLVRAQERVANSVEIIARKMRDGEGVQGAL